MQLSQHECRVVLEAVRERIKDTKLSIEALTEPDERYERYDLQQDLAFLQSAECKLKEAAK